MTAVRLGDDGHPESFRGSLSRIFGWCEIYGLAFIGQEGVYPFAFLRFFFFNSARVWVFSF